MKPKQLFFRADERDAACLAASQCNETLFEIVDKRSKRPSVRMYVLTLLALIQMQHSKLWRRMWVAHEVELLVRST